MRWDNFVRINRIPLDGGDATVGVDLARPERIKERTVAASYTWEGRISP